MELTAQLFRTLSSETRIRILRLLTVLDEQNVSAIALATSRLQCRTSVDLRVLTTSGLLWRRRSGRAIYYRLAERPARSVTSAALAMLRSAFRPVRTGKARTVAMADRSDDPECSDAALVAWFASFTHPRRLQIIAFLNTNSSGTTPVLSEALHMSPRACLRHVATLSDGGVLRLAGQLDGDAWELAPCTNPSRRKVLRAVIAESTRAKG